MSLPAQIIAHHIRLMGLAASVVEGNVDVETGKSHGAGPVRLVLALAAQSVAAEGISVLSAQGTERFLATAGADYAWGELRSFHPSLSFSGDKLVPVVTDAKGRIVWGWLPNAQGGVLFIGTDLAADLTLLRQGDPAAAANRPIEAQWGIAGERPNYLFEGQLDADKPHDRMADWWMWTLRDALIRHAGAVADDVLPFGAKGMVIVTGDDDQASMEAYRAQEKLLGRLPITYFLHPLTKHTRETLAEHAAARNVEWELHPDALDTPHEYDSRFAEQAAWFKRLKGHAPRLVRNHGFLNDGYWGHMKSWEAHGISGSSNLPGVDGKVLNGSLLPARLALDGELTSHWSVLTAFGDGVMFALGWHEYQARQAIHEAGQRIIESGVPGILVFNLHPENHERATCMHEAVHKLVESGFSAMTLGAALNWFAARDAGHKPEIQASMIEPLANQPTCPCKAEGHAGVQSLPFWKKGRLLWVAAREILGARRSN